MAEGRKLRNLRRAHMYTNDITKYFNLGTATCICCTNAYFKYGIMCNDFDSVMPFAIIDTSIVMCCVHVSSSVAL